MLVSHGSHPTEYNTTTEETGKSGDDQAAEDENKARPMMNALSERYDRRSFRTI